MRWSYAFSYGSDNQISFDSFELLQLVGRNGHGKSSIALLLEEVLYNKNSKGIKKADVVNRYSGAKQYTIELDFSKDADEYEVKTKRGSTQTIKLTKNGEDISAHTPTATYKLIEEILGFDHKTFTQIVYQSSPFSLQFLTATDTNRKKFLIELLKLTKYSTALEHYKDLAKDLAKDADVLSTKLKLASNILSKYTKADLVLKEPVEITQVPAGLVSLVSDLKLKLMGIDKTNAQIAQNNSYRTILDSLTIPVIPNKPEDATPLKIKQSELTKQIASLKATANGRIVHKCPTCSQAIDNTHLVTIKEQALEKLPDLYTRLAEIEAAVTKNQVALLEYTRATQAHLEWEKYYGLVDKNIDTELIDKNELSKQIANTTNIIKELEAEKSTAERLNVSISAHNARVEVIKQQLESAEEESAVISMQLAEVQGRLTNVQLLVKTFSTTGLVAYKIECLVKDLESLTNDYLQDMSDGRFQLAFKMGTNDKLDVIITDNGNDIDIAALSNGELARVNVSTLLAIRKLMQSLSHTSVNLLILDETVESLDIDGKEKLVEVLLAEEHLNTVLVSHGFSHPLLEKLSIVKEKNVSRIE